MIKYIKKGGQVNLSKIDKYFRWNKYFKKKKINYITKN